MHVMGTSTTVHANATTTYTDTTLGGSNSYPWANYPYDYWNLWVNHTGSSQDRGEPNLDQLTASYDVIVFKHCFPVSGIGPDSDCSPASVASQTKTIANLWRPALANASWM